MRKLIYSMGVSLDGFIAGPGGEIDWSAPDEELHRFHNRQTRELGAHLCGRRLYEVMAYWETAEEKPSTPEHEFTSIWKALPKIVFSKTLERVEGNARLVRGHVADEVTRLKEQPGKDLAVGGASLASTLIELGLVDEYRLLRQSGPTGRRHTLLPGFGSKDRPGAGRDTDRSPLASFMFAIDACEEAEHRHLRSPRGGDDEPGVAHGRRSGVHNALQGPCECWDAGQVLAGQALPAVLVPGR